MIKGAAAFSNAFFGPGTGTILLDNLGCTGTETRLVNCPHNGIGLENCVHAEDAGLRCAGKFLGMHTCSSNGFPEFVQHSMTPRPDRSSYVLLISVTSNINI